MFSMSNSYNTLLTIAIPTYNGKKTIGSMLNILLPQINDSVEVLISDNCSDGESVAIIKDYCARYPFIRYVRNERNLGADANFLQCMRLAKSKYVLLLSDDDILVENALSKILCFLGSHEEMGLIFLSTANFYINYISIEKCVHPIKMSERNICTSNKKLFMEYAFHYWGFVSSFIVLKDSFEKINAPEQYFGSYWLQSYIHILCANSLKSQKVGVVGNLCIAAGVYLQQNNIDVALVDGINYRSMLDFAIENGFDAEQLNKWYIKRLCLLASHALVKEKAAGNRIIDKKMVFMCSKIYWQAWVKIYPFYFMPARICKLIIGIKRKQNGAEFNSSVNRLGDVGSLRTNE